MIRSAPWPALRRNLIAILRGVTPGEIDAVGDALIEAGFEAIEVPMNSPDALVSVERLARRAPDGVLVGAGTVLDTETVGRLADAGGRILVSPNVDTEVLAAAAHRRLVTMPGVFTPTEAFLALKAGASALKIFPASVMGPSGLAALRAVLPEPVLVGAVGGVADSQFAAYLKAGAGAFGLGSSLWRPGMPAGEVGARARAAVAAWDRAVLEGAKP